MGAGLAVISPRQLPNSIIVAATGLAAVGLGDDLAGGLSPKTRLVAQAVAGLSQGLSRAGIGAVVFPSVVNVVNFMDGANGMSAGTAIVWGVNAMCAEDGSAETALVADLGLLTLSSAVGFVPWNLPEAKLFLGDVGSYLLGGVMAAALTYSAGSPTRFARTAAPLGLYFVDAAQALVIKWRRGESLTEAHRKHVYQQLIDAGGLSHGQVAGVHALLSGIVAMSWRRSNIEGALLSAAVATFYLHLPRLLAARSERHLKTLRGRDAKGKK